MHQHFASKVAQLLVISPLTGPLLAISFRFRISGSGPTFEDLTFDDSLDDLHRIATYARSAIALQRLVHVRMMADVAAREGFAAAAQFILPLLDALLSDEEFLVRQHTAEQLRGLAEVAVKKGGAAGYEALLNTLLPAVARLLADAQPEVRVAAGETLVSVAGLVRAEDIGARVLTIVLQLAHDEEQEELRMTAVSRTMLRLQRVSP